MKFLNYHNDDSPLIIKEKFETYRQYLQDNKQSFPESAFDFAIADWHYNPQDQRCPHDSWLESLQISEQPLPSPGQERGIEIQLVLLGAYHDGKIKIRYEAVKGYSLNLAPDFAFEIKAHGDWIIDEICLSEHGWLTHEIKFWLKGEWFIECENIKFEWLPFEK
jgi:hypothetical protein